MRTVVLSACRSLLFTVSSRLTFIPFSFKISSTTNNTTTILLIDRGGEVAMEALGVSTVSASATTMTTAIIHGVDANARNRRNIFTAPLSPFTQFCRAHEDRKLSAASEDVRTFEWRGYLRTCRDVFTGGRSKLAFVSLVSGLSGVQSSLAVSYDDVVGSAEEAAASVTDSFSLDFPQVDTSSLTDFLSSNPLALLGGGGIVALSLLIATILKKPEGYGTVSAKQAFEKLGNEELNGQLLDIRVADDAKSEGKPDLKAYKKRVIQLPYTSETEEYVAKVLTKFKDAEDTTIYVLDRFDGNSLNVAKLLAQGGFKAAYAIKDGAEGPSGWQTSELPWAVPQRFSLDLGGFKELFSTSDTGNILPATLGVAAAAGVGLVVFSEAETALQLVGSAALVQLFVKKFLFAADRKKTLEELKTFLDTKVAPKEIVDELKDIADVLIPKYEEVQAASVNGAAVVENTVTDIVNEATSSLEAETSTQAPSPSDVVENTVTDVVDEATSSLEAETSTQAPTPAEPIEEGNQEVDTTVNSSTELPRTARPLSPYAQYPGLKPPSSPTPAKPSAV